ncbi:MAG: hypothetical protein U9N73_01215 [Candidatus Auribacterota bacterium]|nr:hypothetical protein [Candidatus Auribacterota bacterium]
MDQIKSIYNGDLDNREKNFMADWLFEYVNTIFDMLPVAKVAEELIGDPGTGYITWLPQTEVTKNYI